MKNRYVGLLMVGYEGENFVEKCLIRERADKGRLGFMHKVLVALAEIVDGFGKAGEGGGKKLKITYRGDEGAYLADKWRQFCKESSRRVDCINIDWDTLEG